MAVMMAVMELSRGHSESRMKSERVGRAWAEKRRAAAKRLVTPTVPGWCRVEGGRIVLDEAKAAVVQRVYRMAAEGYGILNIVKALNAEGVKPVAGRSQTWANSTVALILSTRATVGEYQPCTQRGRDRREPDGAPVPGYYPAVVTEAEWHAVQQAKRDRATRGRGRSPTRTVNVFGGITRDARTGRELHFVWRRGARRVEPTPSVAGTGVPWVSFDAVVLESAILSRLREIDPRDVLPKLSPAGDRVAALKGRKGEVEGQLAKIRARLRAGDDLDTLVAVVRDLEGDLERVEDDLAAAQREAAVPLSEAWDECQSILTALDASADQDVARVRLRTAVRRIVLGVWCLFTGTKTDRIAAVQIWFEGGQHRDYVILHRPCYRPTKGGPPDRGEWWVRALLLPGKKGEFDLRNSADAAALEDALARAPLAPV
jgi:hypothetical protein